MSMILFLMVRMVRRAAKVRIKISTAGSLNKPSKISGFTLVELIVVISIVSLLLLFSLPVFRSIDLFSDSTRQVGDIVRLVNDLKSRSIEQDKDFILNIDAGAGVLWVTDDAMDEEAVILAKDKGVQLSEGLTLLDVEFPRSKQTDGEYQIKFRKQGYSDFVFIHLMDDEENITLKIEPFLSQVQVLESHIYLDDCL